MRLKLIPMASKETSKVEIINGRFVAGTKERLEEIARRESALSGEKITVSTLVERAVMEKYPNAKNILDRLGSRMLRF